MAKTVSGINTQILVWARERAGMTIAQVAKATGRDVSVIEAWESGDAAPTYPQLEDLAYRVYKRPLALFFFPDPLLSQTPSIRSGLCPTLRSRIFRQRRVTESDKLERCNYRCTSCMTASIQRIERSSET